ncbi:hypothetical protein DFH28DRAFT_891283 [Melampsora americana]|nr:hypothetical protein DFH28DRAFT_891283 [Melampsora americana]
MEGVGPTGSMVISEFYALKAHLDRQAKELQMGEALLPMIRSMQAHVNKYLEEAMNCDTPVMASMLNPFFRLQIFEQGFGPEHRYTIRARNLFQAKFDKRKKEVNSTSSSNEVEAQGSTPNMSQPSKSVLDSVFQLFKTQDPQVARDEVAAYLKGAHPMAASDNARECKAVLPWWSVSHPSFFLVHLPTH